MFLAKGTSLYYCLFRKCLLFAVLGGGGVVNLISMVYKKLKPNPKSNYIKIRY